MHSFTGIDNAPLKKLPVIRIEKGLHRGADTVQIFFDYNPALIPEIKKLPGARWSQTTKCWYIPKEKFDLHQFLTAFKGKAFLDYSALKSQKNDFKEKKTSNRKTNQVTKKEIPLPRGYLEMLDQKRYSENTKKIYTSYMRDFVHIFKNRDLTKVTKEQITRYILWLIKEKDISPSQQNQRINAIKFYYEKVLGREKEYYTIERPRKSDHLPDVLSREEIKAMLAATENIKHKCIISLIYSCGLRRSEAINLKLPDIDKDRMVIKVRGAKGDKDRYVNFSQSLLTVLRDYYNEYKTKTYLFEGPGGNAYSAESVWKVVKQAAERAKIRKRVYPHILRHCFATHNIEQGIDIRYIQEWMGHNSIKTTQRYTHVAGNNFKFKNLLDDIL